MSETTRVTNKLRLLLKISEKKAKFPTVKLKLVDSKNLSLEKAEKLNKYGKWTEAANIYYSILETSSDLNIKMVSLYKLMQCLINDGAFTQVENIEKKYSSNINSKLNKEDKNLLLAYVSEKYGWVEDYKGNPSKSIEHFTKAKGLVTKLKDKKYVSDKIYLESAVNQFLGRAYYTLACHDIDKEINIKKGIECYKNEIKGTRLKLAKKNKENVYGMEGFLYMWLARFYHLNNQTVLAHRNLEKARSLWQIGAKLSGSSAGIQSHYYLLKGVFAFDNTETKIAQKCFEKSLKIREKFPYSRGKAASLLGLAMCAYVEENKETAIELAKKAYKEYPTIFKKGLV